ncbi:hypothetical protein AX14_004496 [Amanita brunnescens Koide BX004]|nr:hypothetical protein AX14_004496 [Amanita brunnescens Koide BX004]
MKKKRNIPNLTSSVRRDLTGQVKKDGDSCFAFGALADFWKGTWTVENGRDLSVAVKVIRSIPLGRNEQYERLKSKVIREASILAKLNHPHITPFYGISFDFDKADSPCLVYPFYASGDLMSYLKETPQASRLELICQVASGLAYLHGLNPPVIHGDIKGSNVLINDNGRACLSDFGLGRLMEVSGFTTKQVGGTCRWMAYELIYDDDEEPTQQSRETDMWAFGMTILEVFTGKAPFSHLTYDASVIFYIVKDRKPRQPTEIKDELWSFLCRCWRQDPRERPTMPIAAFFLDFLFKRSPTPEECTRLLDLLASKNTPDNTVDKFYGEDLDPVVCCNYPNCRMHFSTLEECQAHESEHWDLLLSPQRLAQKPS